MHNEENVRNLIDVVSSSQLKDDDLLKLPPSKVQTMETMYTHLSSLFPTITLTK